MAAHTTGLGRGAPLAHPTEKSRPKAQDDLSTLVTSLAHILNQTTPTRRSEVFGELFNQVIPIILNISKSSPSAEKAAAIFIRVLKDASKDEKLKKDLSKVILEHVSRDVLIQEAESIVGGKLMTAKDKRAYLSQLGFDSKTTLEDAINLFEEGLANPKQRQEMLLQLKTLLPSEPKQVIPMTPENAVDCLTKQKLNEELLQKLIKLLPQSTIIAQLKEVVNLSDKKEELFAQIRALLPQEVQELEESSESEESSTESVEESEESEETDEEAETLAQVKPELPTMVVLPFREPAYRELLNDINKTRKACQDLQLKIRTQTHVMSDQITEYRNKFSDTAEEVVKKAKASLENRDNLKNSHNLGVDLLAKLTVLETTCTRNAELFNRACTAARRDLEDQISTLEKNIKDAANELAKAKFAKDNGGELPLQVRMFGVTPDPQHLLQTSHELPISLVDPNNFSHYFEQGYEINDRSAKILLSIQQNIKAIKASRRGLSLDTTVATHLDLLSQSNTMIYEFNQLIADISKLSTESAAKFNSELQLLKETKSALISYQTKLESKYVKLDQTLGTNLTQDLLKLANLQKYPMDDKVTAKV